MAQDNHSREGGKPKHSHGGLVGNYQESEREEATGHDGTCERAPGGLVGNHQQGQPGCDPQGNTAGRQPPPKDGELSPHETSSDRTKSKGQE